MNRKQRIKNRETAKWLKHQQICPECGEPGLHYVYIPMSIEDIFLNVPSQGFWTCNKFYDENGRRKHQ
jgi:hypothetical protein